jgi:hypothetical protein
MATRQVVDRLAAYLDVPLRYPLLLRGSRSAVVDSYPPVGTWWGRCARVRVFVRVGVGRGGESVRWGVLGCMRWRPGPWTLLLLRLTRVPPVSGPPSALWAVASRDRAGRERATRLRCGGRCWGRAARLARRGAAGARGRRRRATRCTASLSGTARALRVSAACACAAVRAAVHAFDGAADDGQGRGLLRPGRPKSRGVVRSGPLPPLLSVQWRCSC